METKTAPIVTIDGMPATGKSEIIIALKHHSKIRVATIPDRGDPELLKGYYSDPKKYAKVLHFSKIDDALRSMKEARKLASDESIDLVVIERSLYGNKVAFDLDVQLGHVNADARALYEERFNSALEAVGHPRYYFLLSDYNVSAMLQRAQSAGMNPRFFGLEYFARHILAQTRVFEDLPPEAGPIIHHFVLNVSTNAYYLNDTIKKIQSLFEPSLSL